MKTTFALLLSVSLLTPFSPDLPVDESGGVPAVDSSTTAVAGPVNIPEDSTSSLEESGEGGSGLEPLGPEPGFVEPWESEYLGVVPMTDEDMEMSSSTSTRSTLLTQMRSKLNALGASSRVTISEASVVCGMTAAVGCASLDHIAFASRLIGHSDAFKWYVAAHELGHVYHLRQWTEVNGDTTYRSLFGSNPEHLADCMASVKGRRVPGKGYGCTQAHLSFSQRVWAEEFVNIAFSLKSYGIIGHAIPGSTLTTKVTPVDPRAKWTTSAYAWTVDGEKVSTASSYTVRASDVGKKITATRTITHNAGSQTLKATVTVSAKANVETVARYGGANRYDTAATIAKVQTGGPVFLVSGSVFADAVSASAPAAAAHGVVALTTAKTLSPQAKSIITVGDRGPVYIIGGAGAVSTNVEAQVRSLGVEVIRIPGRDRYETSRNVARHFYSNAKEVFIATGRDYPDALGAGAVAGNLGAPLLLVPGDRNLDAASRAAIQGTGAITASIVGGPGAVSAAVENGIKSLGLTTSRYFGSDRYETNTALARRMGFTEKTSWIASGSNYPDALTASALAGTQNTGLLLVRATCMPKTTYALIASAGVTTVRIAGGPGVVSTASAQAQKVC